MKSVIILIGLMMSSAAMAETVPPSIEARILPNATVVSVHCTDPSNMNHDEAMAGEITVKTEEGKVASMNIVISRFSDVKGDAAQLCKQMKALKKSGRPAHLIFQEYYDIYQDTQAMKIMGVIPWLTYDPLYNG